MGRTPKIRNLKKRKNLRRALNEQPAGNRVSYRDLVNVASLQLSEKVLWIYSARLDDALVTAAVYPDRGGLKRTLY